MLPEAEVYVWRWCRWRPRRSPLRRAAKGWAGVDTDPNETGGWQIRSLRAPAGYMAAVGAEGQFALRQRTTLCPPNPKLFERPTAPQPSPPSPLGPSTT
jgi:hypothetical protein